MLHRSLKYIAICSSKTALVVALLAVSGCGYPKYVEPELQARYAVVSVASGMRIDWVDNLHTGGKFSVRVTPGAHVFAIVRRGHDGVIAFDVKPGRTYQINATKWVSSEAERSEGGFFVWVTDEATGATVVGRAHPKETTRSGSIKIVD